MKQVKIIVRSYNTKDGRSFTKAFAKGQYLPIALCDNDTIYTIKFVGGEMPTKDGVYSVSYEDGALWLDTRDGYADKNIVRVKPQRCVFEKSLKSKQ